MSGLAALLAGHNPPGLYQWHSAAHVPDVRHAVEEAGWRCHYLDGWTVEDASTFRKAAAVALDLPDEAASDSDALAEAVAALRCEGCEGVVLLWDGWSPLARHDEEAFTATLGAMRSRTGSTDGGRFAVILRGDGPPLDLPELPHKH